MMSKSQSKRLKLQTPGVPSVREQAAVWLENGKTRNRRPFRPKTYQNYKSMIDRNINPFIGDNPINLIDNIALKSLTGKLKAKNLAPGSIQLILNIIKEIRGSAKNERGEELFPYTWDAETIDAPEVISKQQKRPIASAQAVQDAISKADKGVGSLIALLAGSGLRIAEALSVMTMIQDSGYNTVWIPEESKIIVRTQRSGGYLTGGKTVPVKTEAGAREVDLPEELNNFLKSRSESYGTQWGKSEGYYRAEFSKLGLNGGFHSLRRFRVTHLRLQGVPDSLVHFWIGHEDSTVTGRYTEVGPEILKRKQEANRAGLGFELPD